MTLGIEHALLAAVIATYITLEQLYNGGSYE